MATKVERLEELKRKFARLPAQLKREVAPALHKGADELIEMQRRFVPVDQGDLRDSIRKEPGRHELSVSVKAGNNRAFYAAMVEFGTVRTTAQPFFFPPYRTLRKRIRGRITRAVRKAIKARA